MFSSLLRLTVLCFLQHFIMGGWLVFVVIRLDVIFAHGMVLKAVPHQDAAQIRMTIENNAVEIKNLPLLKFAAAPNRRERRKMDFICAVFGAHSDDDRPMLQ